MPKPIIRIHNIETNEIIDREMTKAEFEMYELEQQKIVERQEAALVKETARQAILDRLGITADEAKILLG